MIRRAGLSILLCSVATLGAWNVPAGARATPPSPSIDALAASETATPGLPVPAPGPSLRASAAAPGGSLHAAATWSFMTTPNKGAIDNHIQEVSCINTARCVGVGYTESGQTRHSLVETLTNGVWKTGKIPERGTIVNNLWNVSCVLGNKCVAVGYYLDTSHGDGVYKTLIATYSGGYWTLDASPNKGNSHNFLFGVDCVDLTHCVAVGRYQASVAGRYRTLVLEKNGASTWQIVTTPNRSTTTTNNFLADVSCADATHCMAVGYAVNDQGVFSTLGLERVGDTWALRSTRNVVNASNDLRDVSCPTATDCVAVGSSDAGTNEQTLIERLVAGTWTIEASPNRAATDNHLWGVSCKNETNCVAVGQSQNATKSWTFVATFDAGTWTQTPSPSRGGTYNFMYGLSCPSVTKCTAGGDYVNIGSQHYRTSVIASS